MIKAIINNSNIYDVSNWDAQLFQGNLQLTVRSTDLNAIKNDFKKVNILEIKNDNNLLATYTSLDTFSEITYVGTVYDRLSETFGDCVRITLTKINIVDQVQRLDEQINPVIDPDNMNLAEYKTYKITILKEQTSASIYSGDHVTLSDGSVETFSFDHNDQIDLIALSGLAMLNPSLELPWHSNGNVCRIYSGYDIIIIYETLYMKLMREITVYNAIHQLILSASTKSEVDNYYYGCTLPAEVQRRVDGIFAKVLATVAEILERFRPVLQAEESTEISNEESEENVSSKDSAEENTNESDEAVEDNSAPSDEETPEESDLESEE